MMILKVGIRCPTQVKANSIVNTGIFDYYITVPSEMFVFGSGDLQNPKEVLTGEEIKRLATAANSDNPVYIIKADEVGKAGNAPI